MCRVDALEVASCVCDFQCPKTVKSVCGSDGLTYDNDCQRKSAQCKLKKEIDLVKNGQCVKVKRTPIAAKYKHILNSTLSNFRIRVRMLSVPRTRSAARLLTELARAARAKVRALATPRTPWCADQTGRITLHCVT